MESLSRRDALRLGVAGLVVKSAHGQARAEAEAPAAPELESTRPILTPADLFTDVSRGRPVPHTLKGEALIKARLTAETWRLEITVEPSAVIDRQLRLADGTALDYAGLLKLGETRGVKFLKAMQCNNIAQPLGQGLWAGVPLRDVIRLAGKMKDVRRVYYWGFHNDDPKQMFRSSLAINQVLDTPPGELPPFVAYRLNGEPIPLERGGPVRMVIPWAHGFKSVKWLNHIVLTNDYKANDTYALENNDPESYLKTAAYLADPEPVTFRAGKPAVIQGTAMVGWPGLERIEFWVRPEGTAPLRDDDPAWQTADWRACGVQPPPADWTCCLPKDVKPTQVWGFGSDGRPKQWPMRYSLADWWAELPPLPAGKYEFRVRTVDKNGNAQPEPRPFEQKSGRNAIQVRKVTIA